MTLDGFPWSTFRVITLISVKFWKDANNRNDDNEEEDRARAWAG